MCEHECQFGPARKYQFSISRSSEAAIPPPPMRLGGPLGEHPTSEEAIQIKARSEAE